MPRLGTPHPAVRRPITELSKTRSKTRRHGRTIYQQPKHGGKHTDKLRSPGPRRHHHGHCQRGLDFALFCVHKEIHMQGRQKTDISVGSQCHDRSHNNQGRPCFNLWRTFIALLYFPRRPANGSEGTVRDCFNEVSAVTAASKAASHCRASLKRETQSRAHQLVCGPASIDYNDAIASTGLRSRRQAEIRC